MITAATTRAPSCMPRARAPSLLEFLLAEQQQLSAVEKFAQADLADDRKGARYQDLLPATPPRPGQQYAFEVDLDRCSGCQACVTGCHSLNGLDDQETWRDVGLLLSHDPAHPFTQTVTTACHHCVEPGCLEGCPVLAYDKDPITGIVHHLDDQCIGCQYCVLKCPYDVPKYSASRGIVRKCDLCSQRLAAHEAPACVQACPTEAIRISLVDIAQVRAELRPSGPGHDPEQGGWERDPDRSRPNGGTSAAFPRAWLPGAPPPSLTLPTTRYLSRRPFPRALGSAPGAIPGLQPAHGPLVGMLVLSQLSAGLFALLPWLPAASQGAVAFTGLGALVAGLASSVFHLGQPLKAWRSFLGWRTSWMSREIIAFGLFLSLAALASRAVWRQADAAWLWPAALAGVLAVFCSGMIYHDTHRACWRGTRSIGRFLASTLRLGLAAAGWLAALDGDVPRWLFVALLLSALVNVPLDLRPLRAAQSRLASQAWPAEGETDAWTLAHSARLQLQSLALLTRARIAAGLVGGVLLPLGAWLSPATNAAAAAVSFGLCLCAELGERYAFFRAVVTPRMPGL